MKKTLFEIAAGFVFYTCHWPETKPGHQERSLQLVDFSAVRFEDLEGGKEEEEEEEEMCSVCLVEFERQDLVFGLSCN
ncbi:unnamed protein product [Ilex paraguariensis]|uniref:Uncharacterized protein n=1 Tax=Ilex paraguariensis TaxID=185542 RepID=A0ABC8UFL5_9AQUA